jgi:hypothetical protein
MLKDEQWGPWVRHYGQGMPVLAGTVVEVLSLESAKQAKNGVVRRVGIAGVDLVNSWSWQPETRSKTKSLPIDLYRIKRPRGMEVLQQWLQELPQPEFADA